MEAPICPCAVQLPLESTTANLTIEDLCVKKVNSYQAARRELEHTVNIYSLNL